MSLAVPTSDLAIARFDALGTEIAIAVTDVTQLSAMLEHTRTCIDEIDETFSRFRPDSELERLHRAGAGTHDVSPLFSELVELALLAARSTDGLFDPTVRDAVEAAGYDRSIDLIERDGPGQPRESAPAGQWTQIEVDRNRGTVSMPPGVRLDFGGIGKGFAVDYTLRRILGIDCGVMLSAGGDLAVTGPGPFGGWPCGVSLTLQDPIEETVLLQRGAIASSGLGRRQWERDGRKFHHLIDPQTGEPAASPWSLVTVVAGSCVAADVAAKVAWLKGITGPSWIESIGLAGRFRDRDDKITTTTLWPFNDEER